MHLFILTPYVFFSAISTTISLTSSLFLFNRKNVPSGKLLGLMLLGTSVWGFFYTLGFSATVVTTKILLMKLSFLGIYTAPIFFLLSVLEFTGFTTWQTPKRMGILFIIPTITILLGFTNEAHHLVWASISPIDPITNLITFGRGPWWWISGLGYIYPIMILSNGLLLWAVLRFMYPFNLQAGIFLLASILPGIGNLLFTLGYFPIPGYDPGSALLGFTGGLLSLATFRFHLFEQDPIEYQQVLNELPDPILILDRQERLVFSNSSAKILLTQSNNNFLQDPTNYKFSLGETLHYNRALLEKQGTVTMGLAANVRHFTTKMSNIHTRNSASGGKIILFNDITLIKQAHSAMQKAAVTKEHDSVLLTLDAELAQLFNSIKNNLSSVEKHLEKNNYPTALGILNTLKLSILHANRDMRHMVLTLQAQPDEISNFSEMLTVYTQKVQSITGLRVQVSLPPEPIEHYLTQTHLFNLLQIIQSCLSLAFYLENTSLAQIIFSVQESTIEIVVSLDGNVVPSKERDFEKKMIDLQEAGTHGGVHLQTRSAFEHGTQVLISIPQQITTKTNRNLLGLRLLIVDNRALFVEALTKLLAASGIIVLGSITIADQAKEWAQDLQPDLVLINPDLMQGANADLITTIRDISPITKVVFLGDNPTDEELKSLVREKTDGFLFSNQTSDEILLAISLILNGHNQYAPGLANRMANLLKIPPTSPKQAAFRSLTRAGLTDKQVRILDALANGKVYKEIAADLSTSESAIKYHVKRIQELLGQQTRNDLIDYAHRIGLNPDR